VATIFQTLKFMRENIFFLVYFGESNKIAGERYSDEGKQKRRYRSIKNL